MHGKAEKKQEDKTILEGIHDAEKSQEDIDHFRSLPSKLQQTTGLLTTEVAKAGQRFVDKLDAKEDALRRLIDSETQDATKLRSNAGEKVKALIAELFYEVWAVKKQT